MPTTVTTQLPIVSMPIPLHMHDAATSNLESTQIFINLQECSMLVCCYIVCALHVWPEVGPRAVSL